MYFKRRRVHSGASEGLGENMQMLRFSSPSVPRKGNASFHLVLVIGTDRPENSRAVLLSR